MDGVTRWLLDGDPAIRWQTLRDLVGAPARAVTGARSQVANEGWGARLLARQDAAGTWAGGLSSDDGMYTPKWTSTTYTLLLLRDLGLAANNPQARKACLLLLDRGLRSDGGLNYGACEQSETCITGMGLSVLSHFTCDDPRIDTIASHLLAVQMPDGGWNCRRPRGATHSSMHTTINVLEGLHLLSRRRGGDVRALRAAQRRGREFLLVHRLFRSHRTGRIIKSEFSRLAFPPRWHYDILRALDHFQAANAPRDPRSSESIDIIRARRRKDGRWPLEYTYAGKTYFQLERRGEPSRWNTLRALRVLKWWGEGDGA